MAKLGGMTTNTGGGSMPQFFKNKMPGDAPVVKDWSAHSFTASVSAGGGVKGGSKPSKSPFGMPMPGPGRGIA